MIFSGFFLFYFLENFDTKTKKKKKKPHHTHEARVVRLVFNKNIVLLLIEIMK